MSGFDGNTDPKRLVCSLIKADGEYTDEDRDRWMRTALGQIAPAGTWPCDLFRSMWQAKGPEDAVILARAARKRFEAIWGEWDTKAKTVGGEGGGS